jgi:putative hydrolase of the HAD superfamily
LAVFKRFFDAWCDLIRHILLDLDHTLYPPHTGLMDEMNRRIERYVVDFLHVPPSEAGNIRRTLRGRHGTTLRGLMVEHGADPAPFLLFVHNGLPGDLLSPDPILKNALSRLAGPLETTGLPVKVHIFTNAPGDYARRVLERLGLSDQVDRLIDLAFTGYIGKPHAEAYRQVEKALEALPGECYLVDDGLENIQGALDCGWAACWVSYGRPVPAGLESVETPADLASHLNAWAVRRPA